MLMALFMSIVTGTERNGGRLWLQPSNMFWVRFVRIMEFEGFFLKLCLEEEKGIRGSN